MTAGDPMGDPVSMREIEMVIGRLTLQLTVMNERLALLQATYQQLVQQHAEMVARHAAESREGAV